MFWEKATANYVNMKEFLLRTEKAPNYWQSGILVWAKNRYPQLEKDRIIFSDLLIFLFYDWFQL
jgi:hypothetical protein